MSLQIRRGLDADRQGITFVEGEIVYSTDVKTVYIGDGETQGGIPVGSGGGGAVISVDGRNGVVTLGDLYAPIVHTHTESQITDLDKYTQAEVDALLFSGNYNDLTNVPTEFNPSAHTHVKSDITDFSDADYATAAQGALADSALQSGQNVSLLVNDAGYLTSVPSMSINDLTDVDIAGITNGQVLKWNGFGFIPADDETGGTGGGIEEAPIDGNIYGRFNGSWVQSATSAQGDLADSAVQPGDNISELFNNVGYLTSIPGTYLESGDNVSELTNDAGYLTTIPGTYLQDNDNISRLTNDAGFITNGLQSGDNVSELTNDAGYLTTIPGTYLESGDNVSLLVNDAGYITLAQAGETNTASNLGAGNAVFAQKVGDDLQFRSLSAGSNITMTATASEITINSTGGGGGDVEEAPQDGTPYSRQDAGWVPAGTGSGGIEEAPNDGQQYGRQNEGWTPVQSGGGSGAAFESIRVNYHPFGTITSVSEASAGITSTSVDGATYLNLEFNYNRPPSSIIYYGYKDLGGNGWGYKMVMPASSNPLNEVLMGGSSGNPAELITNMLVSKIRLQVIASETLADNGEHSYIFFLF